MAYTNCKENRHVAIVTASCPNEFFSRISCLPFTYISGFAREFQHSMHREDLAASFDHSISLFDTYRRMSLPVWISPVPLETAPYRFSSDHVFIPVLSLPGNVCSYLIINSLHQAAQKNTNTGFRSDHGFVPCIVLSRGVFSKNHNRITELFFWRSNSLWLQCFFRSASAQLLME